MYDKVRVYFNNGDSTVICVPFNDDIRDAVVEMCDNEGYDYMTVTHCAIEETITPGYNRWDDEAGGVIYVPPQFPT